MFCKLRRLELLRSGQLSDCELHVWYADKSQKSCCRQFRCHKIMLVSASEEFNRMINDPEFEENKGVLSVNDASPDAYETLLLYIYTYEIYNEITIEMCADLIYLSSKYKMPDFVDGYIGKLTNQNWPMGTVLKIFQLANEHNRPAMMKLVGLKIVPIASQLLSDNSFLTFSVKELQALIVILKSAGTIPDKQLLLALKKYQTFNNLHYGNMSCFQQFVEVTHLFDDVLFEADGTLAVTDDTASQEETQAAEEHNELEPPANDAPMTSKDVDMTQMPTSDESAGEMQAAEENDTVEELAADMEKDADGEQSGNEEKTVAQEPPNAMDQPRGSVGSGGSPVTKKMNRSAEQALHRSSARSSKRHKS